MIDIFNEVYTSLTTALDVYALEKGITIWKSSIYNNMPSQFPFVSMDEINNAVDERGSDCCEIENFADIDYEINIYTKSPLQKSSADEIANVVDTALKTCGLVRNSKNNFSENDGTTYHIIIRYSGVVSKDHTIYRR